jgi:3-oxoacyl-[acyl-carrier protein] reductase
MQRKTILVTGATGGIGDAVCRRLAGHGYSVLMASRDEAKLESLSIVLNAAHVQSSDWIALDMTSDTSISAFAEEMKARAIVLDGMAHMPPQPHRSDDPMPDNEDWRKLFQDSFIGPLAVLKAAISMMKPDPASGRRAKIVMISGISSAQVLGHYATANVLRCAWLAEAKTLAFALGPKGIHINTLSLGGTMSPWYRDGLEGRAKSAGMTFEERLVEETSNVPLRKYGEPAEVAGAVEGLLSDFSDHMTGLNIMHDGGFTRAY